MTIAKETPRPTNQHRASTSSMASSLPTRNSYARSHSHAIAIGAGSYNPTHRVTRRKSTTLNAATSAAAITAAINIDANGEIEGSGSRNRRGVSSKAALGSLNNRGSSYPSPPSSLPQGNSYAGKGSSTLDGPGEKGNSKATRGRRASEASVPNKKKSGNGDLKCETCGKGYKHSSCLTKHLWEHTPEWQLTSKLLISKHQQVQLLEAASVLMAMNVDPIPGADSGKLSDSENSSASPDGSGFDSREDEPSSAETTPPPQNDRPSFGHRKTFSNASSEVSRSYQSNYSESASRYPRQWSTSSSRPPTAQTSVTQSYPDDADQDMVAAMGLLNCASSYKSPRTGPTSFGSHIPPVPELPEQYRAMSGASYQPRSLSNVVPRRFQEDVDMDEDSYSDDDDKDTRRADEADEGVFGNMEE